MYTPLFKYAEKNRKYADSLNALVISEDGSLYKCRSDIGRKDLCLSNIVDRSYSIAKAIRYSKYDPTRDKKCSLSLPPMNFLLIMMCYGKHLKKTIFIFLS